MSSHYEVARSVGRDRLQLFSSYFSEPIFTQQCFFFFFKCVLASILLQNVFIHCYSRVNSTLTFGLGCIRGATNLNVEPTDARESQECCSNILSVASCGLPPFSLFIYTQTLPRLLSMFKFPEQWLFRRTVFLNV